MTDSKVVGEKEAGRHADMQTSKHHELRNRIDSLLTRPPRLDCGLGRLPAGFTKSC